MRSIFSKKISSFEDFANKVEYFVNIASEYSSNFIVFPELFTTQLLSIPNTPIPAQKSIEELAKYTPAIIELFSRLARNYKINIIGGSHATKDDNNKILNICYTALRDGSIHKQEKIHPTPSEKSSLNIQGGNKANVINTDCCKIGIIICYDSEFPELARNLVDNGAEILFVPFCTDLKQGYLRVRYCSQARAVENQVYVATSGNVGYLENVETMNINYAQSAIFTPCYINFNNDGIAAEATANTEMIIFADLDLAKLRAARIDATVNNLKDRRHDLYAVKWNNIP
ncbi:MAG: carbon-nitrogen hydrolase family protein [Alphaproteobacteria bacterium]